MYEELVESLRLMSKQGKRYGMAVVIMEQAADAIEELQQMVDASIPKSDAEIIISEVAKVQPKWIPVTERLPEEDCRVLAYYGFNHGDGYLGMMFMQVLDYFARDPRPHFQHEGLNGMTVTHWMPLPVPPKEEEK